MENLRTQKLLQYTALSTAFLVAHQANAQEYHEYDPYLPLTNAHDVFIDVDDDGVADFSFYFAKDWFGSSSAYGGELFQFTAQQFNDAQVMVTTLPAVDFYSSIYTMYCTLPEVLGVRQLNEHVTIGPDAEWGQGEIMARVEQCGSYGGYGIQGEWQLDNVTRDYFVGFKVFNPEPHFGWMRLRHRDYGHVDYVKDFFIESTVAGETETPDLYNHVAPAADNLNLYYSVDGKLMLDFEAASDEDSLQAYRIILRNAIYTSTLTATSCEITLPENYIEVPKSGAANYTVDISSLTNDWTSDVLNIGDEMSAYVYSKFNYPVTLLNGLSPESNEIEKLFVTSIINTGINSHPIQIWNDGNQLHIISGNETINNIAILDVTGRIIINEHFTEIENVTVPISELATGIYIVQLETNSGVFAQKIFK